MSFTTTTADQLAVIDLALQSATKRLTAELLDQGVPVVGVEAIAHKAAAHIRQLHRIAKRVEDQ